MKEGSLSQIDRYIAEAMIQEFPLTDFFVNQFSSSVVQSDWNGDYLMSGQCEKDVKELKVNLTMNNKKANQLGLLSD